MIEPRLFLCGGAAAPEPAATEGRRVVRLDVGGADPNVHLQIEDVARAFATDISPRMTDFLELASYVSAADSSTQRGSKWSADGTIEPWSRDFHFVMGVHDSEFWARPDVRSALERALTFLSDDRFQFTFVSQARPLTDIQLHLNFGNFSEWPFQGVDRVLMFSGGLDSLAGAVEAARQGEKLVLVSHRPVSTLSSRQVRLVDLLRECFPDVQVLHVPIWVNKNKNLGREHTQRARSFLFTALGTAVAQSVGAGGVRFFENGVVSINLAVADEVLRARASRTTHPLALKSLAEIASLVAGRSVDIDNPFIFKTKAEVVNLLKGDTARLVGYTCSCAHTGIHQSKTQLHCGACSQCIDRRIATVATGLAAEEPEGDYKSDVFTGPRESGYEQNIAVNYARHGMELAEMSDDQIAARFNRDISRAARCFPVPRDAARQLVAMHRRHGETVARVLREGVREAAGSLVEGKLEPTSMLAMVAGQRHLESSWKSYADRVVEVLSAGLPSLCRRTKPATEPLLQEMCDGLLKGHGLDLRREYPFMAWGWSTTKPDWSNEPLRLWVELKYVRQKTDVRSTTRAIAEDLTKYGDNGRRVVFVVYDPLRHILDEEQFAEPVRRRSEMFIHFIR